MIKTGVNTTSSAQLPAHVLNAERVPGPLGLILTAAHYHPDGGIRAGLLAAFEGWVDGRRPRYSRDEIRRAIEAEEGTPIEPFILSDDDVECAVSLARAAFSKAGGVHRVHILSRENLGVEGGLVLTSNLRPYYLERFALGKRRGRSPKGYRLIPRCVPSISLGGSWMTSRGVKVRLEIDDRGPFVRVQSPQGKGNLLDLEEARRLQENSCFLGSIEPLSKLGFRIEISKSGWRLIPGSSEAMIRFSALAGWNAIVIFSAGEDSDLPVVAARLEPVDEGSQSLHGFVTAAHRPLPWIHCSGGDGIVLSTQQRSEISRWLMPHPSWLASIAEEKQ